MFEQPQGEVKNTFSQLCVLRGDWSGCTRVWYTVHSICFIPGNLLVLMQFGNIWNNSETSISRNNLEGLIYCSWWILTLLLLVRLALDQTLNHFSSSILSFQDCGRNLIFFIDCSFMEGNRQVHLSSLSWAESQSVALDGQPAKNSEINFLTVQHS